MPFVPVPAAVEVRLEYTIGSAEQMVNVLHFHNLTPVVITPTIASALALDVQNSWDAHLRPLQSTEVVLQAIAVKDISAPDLPAFRTPVGLPGTAVGDVLPFGVALVSTLYTASGSRGGRGRIFHGGFTEAANGGGDAATQAVADACTAFVTDIAIMNNLGGDAAADFNLGVVSRAAHVGGNPLGAAIPPIVRDVVSFLTNRRWDTQRRRSNKIRI